MMIEQHTLQKMRFPYFEFSSLQTRLKSLGKRYTLDSSRKDLKWMHLKGSLRITWKTRTLSL